MAVDLVALATQRRLSITAAARDENSIIAAQEQAQQAKDAAAKLKAANASALGSNVTFAGFGVKDVSAFFGGLAPAAVEALLIKANGGALNADQSAVFAGIDPKLFKSDIIPGLQHLAEHEKGSHYAGDFNKALANPFLRIGAGIVTAGLSEAAVAGYQASEGDFRSALLIAAGAGVTGTGVSGATFSGVTGSLLDNTFARQLGYKTPTVKASNETDIATQAAQEERRRRAMISNQNRLIKTTPLGARISGNQLGGANTVTGG